MKRLGVFLLLPRWDDSPLQSYPTALISPVERGTMRVKCLAQEHNTVPWTGPEPFDPESSALTKITFIVTFLVWFSDITIIFWMKSNKLCSERVIYLLKNLAMNQHPFSYKGQLSFIAQYSFFVKGCPTEAWKRMRHCRKVLWVFTVACSQVNWLFHWDKWRNHFLRSFKKCCRIEALSRIERKWDALSSWQASQSVLINKSLPKHTKICQIWSNMEMSNSTVKQYSLNNTCVQSWT